MGIRLVMKLLQAAIAARLSQRELHVLALMAATALDTPNEKGQQPGLYFAGWQHLAIGLGWDPAAPRTYERVRRILKSLREKGLIVALEDHPRTRVRQCYRLTLDSVDVHLPIDISPHVAGSAVPPPQEGGISPHESGSSAPTWRGGPRKHLGEPAGHMSEDSTHPSASTTGGTREIDPMDGIDPHQHVGEREDRCQLCGEKSLNRIHMIRRSA